MGSDDGKKLEKTIINFQRRNNTIKCCVDGCNDEFASTTRQIQIHLAEKHRDLIGERDPQDFVRNFQRGIFGSTVVSRDQPAGRAIAQAQRGRGRAVTADKQNTDAIKRGFVKMQTPQTDFEKDFEPRTTPTGTLWDPASNHNTQIQRTRQAAALTQVCTPSKEPHTDPQDEAWTGHMKPPAICSISLPKLIGEVKGIYSGLVLVESKCMKMDTEYTSEKKDEDLNNNQWTALIYLHRTLLHEHHDFLLSSQHPKASDPVKALAARYAMPARLWRHGIHAFLELLRSRLPGSFEHMICFIYMAYSFLTLLHDSVPAFRDTWIECMGDLGRYRMAIEENDREDRAVWTAVSQHWYSKGTDHAPKLGRLYHHLAILSRPNAVKQLFYYTKSLCVGVPFEAARESIMTLFNPYLKSAQPPRSASIHQIDVQLVRAHGILFSGQKYEEFAAAVLHITEHLGSHIDGDKTLWKQAGYYIASATCCSLLSYGRKAGPILRELLPSSTEILAADSSTKSSFESEEKPLQDALSLAQVIWETVFLRSGDHHCLPFVHVTLMFMYRLSSSSQAMSIVERKFPWKLLSLHLNHLLNSYQNYVQLEKGRIPPCQEQPRQEEPSRPLPEEWATRGALWVEDYFPKGWFDDEKFDDDEKFYECASMTPDRKERILRLGRDIARHEKWLLYDVNNHCFTVPVAYEKPVELRQINMDDRDDAAEFALAGKWASPSGDSATEDYEGTDVETGAMDVDESNSDTDEAATSSGRSEVVDAGAGMEFKGGQNLEHVLDPPK